MAGHGPTINVARVRALAQIYVAMGEAPKQFTLACKKAGISRNTAKVWQGKSIWVEALDWAREMALRRKENPDADDNVSKAEQKLLLMAEAREKARYVTPEKLKEELYVNAMLARDKGDYASSNQALKTLSDMEKGSGSAGRKAGTVLLTTSAKAAQKSLPKAVGSE